MNAILAEAENEIQSDATVEGGGPGSAYPPDWDSSTEPLSAAQMDSVLEVVTANNGNVSAEKGFFRG